MRYFAELTYKGTNYFGWQRQPRQISVQEVIETAFSTILRTEISIVGCGRTDTGVHASQYFIHFDFEGEFPGGLTLRINKFLPRDIVIHRIFEVSPEVHSRFDAKERSYEYHMGFIKNPFTIESVWYNYFIEKPDFEKMQAAAKLLLNYTEFYPFCKSRTDVKTMTCKLSRAEWIFDEKNKNYTFHISANRFLRGMVRLVVGVCINIGLGKVSLEELKHAMDSQTRLEKNWSVPSEGLFLTAIKYE